MHSRTFFSCVALLALVSCGPPSSGVDAGPGDAGNVLPGTYANVADIFNRTCVFSSCHGGVGAGASNLNFARSMSAGTLLADLEAPSCQYSAMPMITPGDPMNSWLYIKVAGAHSGMDLTFTPDPGWDHGGLMPLASGMYPASTCPLTSRGAIVFGTIMPQGTVGLPANQAETIRLWILAGAPGP